MNWLRKIFGLNKKKSINQNHTSNFCPDCGKKGYQTSLIEGRSYACKKCEIWWVNPF